MNFNSAQHIHFIGIGGIGVSALARMMLQKGKTVSGSEATLSRVTADLEGEGVEIFEGHDGANIPPHTDVVVYTTAIPSDNPELLSAHERLLPLLTYPQALGEVSKAYKTVAVSGTHGKTTTTAMLAEIAIGAGLDPTVVVGSYLKKPKNTNFILGGSNLLILEACEYKKAFLNLSPDILIITNIDRDHLDCYESIDEIKATFREMITHVKSALVCNPNDPNVRDVVKGAEVEVRDYTVYDAELSLMLPGDHNRQNAQAALTVASLLGADAGVSKKAVEAFEGTWRRFEYKGRIGDGSVLYDDYAHHPTEIEATIQGFREKFPDKRLVLVFQPHLYSRTKLLFNEFADSLSKADVVYLLPIYGARERLDTSVSSEDLVSMLETKGTFAKLADKDEIAILMRHASSEDVWVTMGAGDVYKVGELALKE